MSLTNAQILTQNRLLIRADILASPDLNAIPNTSDGASAIADLYNLPAAPDFIVWKARLHEQEITSLTSSEGTTWSWSAFIARSAAEHEGWSRMFNGTYIVDPSLAQVRLGFSDIFSGGTGAAQRTHITAISKERATRFEKLLSTGAGTLLAPAIRSYVGLISSQDLSTLRAN